MESPPTRQGYYMLATQHRHALPVCVGESLFRVTHWHLSRSPSFPLFSAHALRRTLVFTCSHLRTSALARRLYVMLWEGLHGADGDDWAQALGAMLPLWLPREFNTWADAGSKLRAADEFVSFVLRCVRLPLTDAAAA